MGTQASAWQQAHYQWDSRAVQAVKRSPAEEPSHDAAQPQDARSSDKKRRRRFQGGGCQVQACSNPLQLAYHKKYHVCREHFTTPCISIDGLNKRFCQKCGRFQTLEAFDGQKRTCRVALETHNARRRKRAPHAGTDSAGGSGAPSAGGSAPSAGGSGAPKPSSSGALSAGGAPYGSGAPEQPAFEEPTGGQGGCGAALGGSPPRSSPVPLVAVKAEPVSPSVHQQAQQASTPTQQAQQASPSTQQAQQASPPPQQAQQTERSTTLPAQAHPAPALPVPAAVTGLRTAQSSATAPPSAARVPGGANGGTLSRAPAAAVSAPGCAAQQQHLQQQQQQQQPHQQQHSQTNPSSTSTSGAPSSQVHVAPVPLVAPPAWQQYNGANLDKSSHAPLAPLAATHAPHMPSQPTGSGSVSNPLACEGMSGGTLEMPPPLPASCSPFPAHKLPSLETDLPSASAFAGQQYHLPGGGFGGSMQLAGAQHSTQTQHVHVQQQQLQEQQQQLQEQQQQQQQLQQQQQQQQQQRQLQQQQQQQQRQRLTLDLMPSIDGADWAPEFDPSALLVPPAPEQQQQLQVLPSLLPDIRTGPLAAVEAYASEATLHRMSLKVFQCTPDQLAPTIRAELESVLQVAPKMLDAYIRPGCTHLTVDLLLRREEAASLAGADVARMLQTLRTPTALCGPAASSAALLQWGGRLASIAGGEGQMAEEVAEVEEPRLVLQPACVAVPPPGQPWPLVQLHMLPAHGAFSSSSLVATSQAVLARQSGRHLAVELWCEPAGTAGPAAFGSPVVRGSPAAETAGVQSAAVECGGTGTADDSSSDCGSTPRSTSSGSGSGSYSSRSDSSDAAYSACEEPPEESGPASASVSGAGLLSPPSGSGSGSGSHPSSSACQSWVRPVGLSSGSCELEVELELPGVAVCQAAAGGNVLSASTTRCRAVLLTSPAPLLVLRDCEAAAEVQLLQAQSSGSSSGSLAGFNGFLRDVGLAAAFLEEKRAAAEPPRPPHRSHRPPAAPLPPHVVAAAAHTAAAFAQRRGMAAVERLLRHAHSLASGDAAEEEGHQQAQPAVCGAVAAELTSTGPLPLPAQRAGSGALLAQRAGSGFLPDLCCAASSSGTAGGADAQQAQQLQLASKAAALDDGIKVAEPLWEGKQAGGKCCDEEEEKEMEEAKACKGWQGRGPGLSMAAIKVEGMLRDLESLAGSGASRGLHATAAGSSGVQPLSPACMLRLAVSLAALYTLLLMLRPLLTGAGWA